MEHPVEEHGTPVDEEAVFLGGEPSTSATASDFSNVNSSTTEQGIDWPEEDDSVTDLVSSWLSRLKSAADTLERHVGDRQGEVVAAMSGLREVVGAMGGYVSASSERGDGTVGKAVDALELDNDEDAKS